MYLKFMGKLIVLKINGINIKKYQPFRVNFYSKKIF